MTRIDGKLPRAFALTKAELHAAADFFAEQSSRRICVPFQVVEVHLQDDAASDAAHQVVMNIVGATDVITQGYDPMPPEPDGIYGELFVNCDRAKSAAPHRKGWSIADELLLYIAHGMDHLSGADDHAPKDYNRMRRRELGWLKAWKEAYYGTERNER